MSGYSIGSLYNGDLHLFSAKLGKKPLFGVLFRFSLSPLSQRGCIPRGEGEMDETKEEK